MAMKHILANAWMFFFKDSSLALPLQRFAPTFVFFTVMGARLDICPPTPLCCCATTANTQQDAWVRTIMQNIRHKGAHTRRGEGAGEGQYGYGYGDYTLLYY